MINNWGELTQTLGLKEGQQEINTRYQAIPYTLSTVYMGRIHREDAFIEMISMRGEKLFLSLGYPFTLDEFNSLVTSAYSIY